MISKLNRHCRITNTLKFVFVISLMCYSSIYSQPLSCTDVKQCLDNRTDTAVCQTIGRSGNTLILKDTKTGLCSFSNCGTNRCFDSKTFYCYELEGKVRETDGSCGDICNNGSCNGGDNICLFTQSKRLREFKTGRCVETCPTTTSPAQCLVNTVGFNCKEVSSETNSRRSNDENGTCVDVCLEGNCYDDNFICNPVGVNRWRQITTSACNTSCLGASCKPNSTSFVCQSTSGTNFKKADGFCATACPLTECISDVTNRICSLNSNNPLTVRRFEDGVCANQCSDKTCFRRENNFNCQEVSATNRRELSSICNTTCTENFSCLDTATNFCLSTNSGRKRNTGGNCLISGTCPSGSCLESVNSNYCSATSNIRFRELGSELCTSQCSGETCWNDSFNCISLDNLNKKLLSNQCSASCTGNSCYDGTTLICKALSITPGSIKVKKINGDCAVECNDTGYCYDSNGICVLTQSDRIKDTNTQCRTSCTGNTCWSVSNSFTCTITDSSNFKAVGSHECKSECEGNTCSSANYVCENVNPQYKLPSGYCSSDCAGSFCISDVANFRCSATGPNIYKDAGNICNTACTGNTCFDSSDYICIGTANGRFKDYDSSCVASCASAYCKSPVAGEFICLANSAGRVKKVDGFCATSCPNNYCSNDSYVCINADVNNIRDYSTGYCAVNGVCTGANCWTTNGYNCEPTSKLRFKELNGQCNTSCSGNSCLEDTYNFICLATSSTNRKTLDGSCKAHCDHGACHDANNVCLKTGLTPKRIRDTDGSCQLTCSGNTCYSSNNDFTCTQTDEFNFKQLDSSCNAHCIGKSCISQTGGDSFLCVPTTASLFKNTDYTCVAECPTKTCLDQGDSRYYCLNTNSKRVRQSVSNNCAAACGGDFCFDATTYHCSNLDTKKRAMNGACTEICQKPHCNNGGSCIQSDINNWRLSNGNCAANCDLTKECISDNTTNFLCTERSEHDIGQPDNACGSNCPQGTCYVTTGVDAYKCQVNAGKIANVFGKCVDECPAGKCLNKITEHCHDLVNTNPTRFISVFGYCENSCNWNTECYDANTVTCKNLSSNNLVQENNHVCAIECDNTGSVARCYSTSNRICVNATDEDGFKLRTSSIDSTCITACPAGECYNDKYECIAQGLNKIDFTTTKCISNCAALSGYCIDGDNCKKTTSALFKLPNGNCTTEAQCGSGYCVDPRNSNRCLATSATNVKRFSDKKCNFSCEIGYCYNTVTFDCEATEVGKLRDYNGACAASCSTRYYIDSNKHCVYTDYDHVILADGTVADACPDNFCMENNTTRKCVATNGTTQINDNGVCNTTCSEEDECFDSTNFNCKQILNNGFKAADGSCQVACGTNQCITKQVSVVGGNGFICAINSYESFESPVDRMCISQCPTGYCFDDNYKCVEATSSLYRNIDGVEVGKCNATCLGNSCKSLNQNEFLCLSTVNSGLKKEAATANCIVECPTNFCHDENGVCVATDSTNFKDVDGHCSNSCTGATCASSPSWSCEPTSSVLRKKSNSQCAANCPGEAGNTECYDPDFICRTISSDTLLSVVKNSGDFSCKCNQSKRCFDEGTCVRPNGDLFSLNSSCTSSCNNSASYCKHPFRNYCAAVTADITKNANSKYCEIMTRITYVGYFSDFDLQQDTSNVVNSYHQLNFLTTYTDENENYPGDYYFSILYKHGNSSVRYSDTKYSKYYDLYSKHLTLDNSYNYVVFYDFVSQKLPGDNNHFSVSVKAVIASCEDDAIAIYNALPVTITNKLIAHPTETGFELVKGSTTYSMGVAVAAQLSKGLLVNSNSYSYEDVLLGDVIERTTPI